MRPLTKNVIGGGREGKRMGFKQPALTPPMKIICLWYPKIYDTWGIFPSHLVGMRCVVWATDPINERILSNEQEQQLR